MDALVTCTLTVWFCALVARPRRPLPGNEVAELVYARLLGRQQRLVLLAGAVTLALAVALLLTHLPQPTPSASEVSTSAARLLPSDQETFPPTCQGDVCYFLQPGGTWLMVQQEGDGTWSRVATVTTLPGR